MSKDLANAEKENTNPITKRIAVLCKMRLLSPALIGSGEEENTKRDVYLDANNNPLIPGTSLAGVLRNVLNDDFAAKLFGPLINSPKDDSETSPLWVLDSEALIEDDGKEAPGKIIIIDNVALSEDKIAKTGAKFDFEAIDRGAYFYLRLQLIVRKHSSPCLEQLLDSVLGKLNTLYIGGKTSRGFGKLQCESIKKAIFNTDAEGLKQWMNFNWDKWIKGYDYDNAKAYIVDDFQCDKPDIYPPQPSVICAVLNLKGTLLIRDDYSTIGDENAAQITSNNLPVIYGTSLVGAIKSGVAKLLKLKHPNCKNYLNDIFGCLDDSVKPPQHHPSKVRVDASYFAKDKRHSVTRVKIDRWTGGAVDRALFTTCPQFKGGVTFTAHYPNGRDDIKQLLLLALQAIDLGIITIGGETAIGRGVFSVKKVCIDGAAQNMAEVFNHPKDELVKKLEKMSGGVANG